MNSSISAFDAAAPAGGDEATGPWRGFVIRTLVTTTALCAGVLGAAVALDPYDTGFGLLRIQGTPFNGPRLGDASRVHDDAFDAAIIGNSHMMSLSPARLSQATGHHFVMLAVPGTGVPEQMVLLDALLARHAPPRALVIGIDDAHCRADPRAVPPTPFPDWLYRDDRLAYLAGLFRASTLEAMGRRLGLAFGFVKPAPRDGTFDLYEGDTPNPTVSAERIAAAGREDWSLPAGAERLGLTMLGARLRRLAPHTQVVLVLPPVAAQTLPLPDTPGAAALAACKAAIADTARLHPGTQVVDWHQPRPGLDVSANFRDATHFYDAIARPLEADIATALAAER